MTGKAAGGQAKAGFTALPPEAYARPRADIEHGDAIVAAAYQLLGEDGLRGLTVRAVLKQASLNRRSFYERFAGKDELVLAVFERSLQGVAAECRAQCETMADPLERLRFTIGFLAFRSAPNGADAARNIRRNAALCREHMRLAEARPKDLQLALRPLIALLAEQLADGMEGGQVRKASPERLAYLVYNLVSTTVHAEVLAQEAAEPDRTRRAQLADDLWDFCRRAIMSERDA